MIPLARDVQPQVGDVEPDGGHLVLGEGARLVGADGGGRSQGLHGGEAADEGVAADHLPHPQGQADGDHGGKPLRHGGDRQAYRRQEQIDHHLGVRAQIDGRALAQEQPQIRIPDHRHDEDQAADDQRSPAQPAP